MDEMTNYLYRIMFHSFLVGFSTCMFLWINWPSKSEKSNFEDSEKMQKYCFECEIETLVKVKNGGMYCSNCGLHH